MGHNFVYLQKPPHAVSLSRIFYLFIHMCWKKSDLIKVNPKNYISITNLTKYIKKNEHFTLRNSFDTLLYGQCYPLQFK